MILRKLSIFGFKSFADKTELRFGEGMTAVVGPNGCGKTNVVDAIRWVFGEQKTSVLRSTHMQDVIFSGTEKRQPLNMAEVTLSISNTKGILPLEYNEVAITRRIFRSGDSEYLINRNVCRISGASQCASEFFSEICPGAMQCTCRILVCFHSTS